MYLTFPPAPGATDPTRPPYACADRRCVSGLTVDRADAICSACAPVYHRAGLDAEDTRSREDARRGTDTQGYF